MADAINKTIKQMYNKQTYFAKYGGEIWLAIIIISIMSSLTGYFSSQGQIRSVKDDWAKHRCNPGWMPFAAAMNDDSSKSGMEYTEENFSYCVENILNSITQVFLEPFYLAVNVLEETISQMAESFGNIGGIFDTLRTFMSSFLSAIIQIILNILFVFKGVLTSMNQLFVRLLGVNNIIINMGKSVGNTFSSTVSTVIILVIEIVVAGLILSSGTMVEGVSLMGGFFTFFIGVVVFATGLALLILFIILLVLVIELSPIGSALVGLVDVFT